mmetsp:Transcript_152841/g.266404  ORF Transcript_152841/g.266404 Transcript_152841/m.266404 type:complete len:366 (-) Transcript_152841:1441-2538(-)
MWIEHDIWCDAALRERHVLCWPEATHHALLAVSRGELVPDDWIARISKLDENLVHSRLCLRSWQGFRVDASHILNVGLEIIVELYDFLSSVRSSPATQRIAILHLYANRWQAVVLQPELTCGWINILDIPSSSFELRSQVCEHASCLLLSAHVLVTGLDDLGLVHDAMAEAALEGMLVDDHRVLHVVARVGDHSNNGICALRMLVEIVLVVHLCAHYGLLGTPDLVNLVIRSIRMIVVRCSHGLLQHLTLIHVAWALIVIGERRESSKNREDLCRLDFLMSVLDWLLLWEIFIPLHQLLPCRILRCCNSHSGLLCFFASHCNVHEHLLEWTDPFDSPQAVTMHRSYQAAWSQEQEQSWKQVLPIR